MAAARQLIVSHAMMIGVALTGSATAEQLAEFVRTGFLDGSAANQGEDVMPYDPEALKMAIKQGGLGVIRDD